MTYLQYTGHNLEEVMRFGEGEIKHQVALGSSSDGMGGSEFYHSLFIERMGNKLYIFAHDVMCKNDEEIVLIMVSDNHLLSLGEKHIHWAALDHVKRGKTAGEKFGF